MTTKNECARAGGDGLRSIVVSGRRLLVVLLSVIGIVAIGFGLLLPSEPTYRGRTLSDWIVATRHHPKDDEARLAMRQLASNSIPTLLEWIRREDRPTPKARIAAARDVAVALLERHRIIKPRPHPLSPDLKGSYRFLAKCALEELGPDANDAVPSLVQSSQGYTPEPAYPSEK